MDKKYDPQIDFVDLVTEAGADGALATLPESENKRPFLANLKYKTFDVSVEGHGSRLIVVVGHEECAGHTVDNAQHKKDLKKAVSEIKKWAGPAKVIGLFLHKKDHFNWLPEIIF